MVYTPSTKGHANMRLTRISHYTTMALREIQITLYEVTGQHVSLGQIALAYISPRDQQQWMHCLQQSAEGRECWRDMQRGFNIIADANISSHHD